MLWLQDRRVCCAKDRPQWETFSRPSFRRDSHSWILKQSGKARLTQLSHHVRVIHVSQSYMPHVWTLVQIFVSTEQKKQLQRFFNSASEKIHTLYSQVSSSIEQEQNLISSNEKYDVEKNKNKYSNN